MHFGKSTASKHPLCSLSKATIIDHHKCWLKTRMYTFEVLEARRQKSVSLDQHQGVGSAVLPLEVLGENPTSDGYQHSLACGHITSISASISTWSLCLDFTLLSRTPIIAFSSLTQPKMISSRDPYLNNICKDSYSKKGLILRFQAYMSWGEGSPFNPVH